MASDVFSRNEVGEKRWTDLKARIVEHNIMMMAKYYTKIRLTRMAKLLALTEAETEDCLSEMVNSLCCLCLFLIIIIQVVAGTVSAKTDRLEGIIDFTEQQVSDELDVAKIDQFVHDDIRPSGLITAVINFKYKASRLLMKVIKMLLRNLRLILGRLAFAQELAENRIVMDVI